MSVEEIKEKLKELYNELPMLCDEDYYNACELIEQLEMQLKRGDSDKE